MLFLFWANSVLGQPRDALSMSQVLDSMLQTAYAHEDNEQYKAALETFIAARDTVVLYFGNNSLRYGSILHDLARVHHKAGRYNEAEKLYLESMQIHENSVGKMHQGYLNSLEYLAILYQYLGRLGPSENLLQSALQLIEAKYGNESSRYAWVLHNLGQVYEDMGQREKAEKCYLEALGIYEKSNDKESARYAALLNVIGGFYHDQGEPEKAERYYLDALKIRGEIGDKKDIDYAGTLSNLAVLYWENGQRDKVEPLVQEAFDITNQLSGDEYSVADLQLKLASYYHEIGVLEIAETKYLEGLKTIEQYAGKNNFDYTDALFKCAMLYWTWDKPQKAVPFFIELNRLNRQRVLDEAAFLSEEEMTTYIDVFWQGDDAARSFLTVTPEKSNELTRELLNNSLFYKGFIQKNSRILAQSMTNAEPALRAKYDRWRALRQEISAACTKPVAARSPLPPLEAEARKLEKELIQSEQNFSRNRRQVTWKELRSSLKAGEAAIEFVHYPLWDKFNTDNDLVYYAAFVVLPGKALPVFIPLFEEKQLDTLLRRTMDQPERVAVLYAASRSGISLDPVPAYGDSLYRMIWKPLRRALQGVRTVYYSPSGLLNRVNLAALPAGSKGEILADRHTIRLLSSTQQVVIPHTWPDNAIQSAILFGDIDYSSGDSSLVRSDIERFQANSQQPMSEGPGHSPAFNPLPGSRAEVHQIEALLRAKNKIVKTHTGAHATEEHLKETGQNGESPDLLHLATHGFFFDIPPDTAEEQFDDSNVFLQNRNPLFRSGLALAGANAAWTGKPVPASIEDGIATAYEISHLNLSNTKLAVLSACQTGLGDIKGSEGVYGLQRAFKMAGVDYLLVSLWQVPDEETAEFMEVFYSTWLGGKAIHEAFATAQKTMRKKHADPYRWAAWVLIE